VRTTAALALFDGEIVAAIFRRGTQLWDRLIQPDRIAISKM